MRLPVPVSLLAACSALLFPALLLAQSTPKPQRLPLWDGPPPNGSGGTDTNGQAYVTVHPSPTPRGATVVICPGGGYAMQVTGAEGHGIAEWLNRHGITGVVLEYRLPAGRPEVPLLDARRAIQWARQRAPGWQGDPGKVGIMGFSAGGHLAATASTLLESAPAASPDPVTRASSRPDFAILVYPVISMDALTHAGIRRNLFGDWETPVLVERFSCERQVTRRTPPTFLAHAIDDTGVVIEHSRRYQSACKAQGVPVRLLELPDGGHGLNGYKGPSWDAWQRESLAWLQQLPSKTGP